jgi:hypothetical protein
MHRPHRAFGTTPPFEGTGLVEREEVSRGIAASYTIRAIAKGIEPKGGLPA